MSMPTLQPRLFLGLRTGIRKGVQYLSELEVLYPAGGILIAHNFTQKRQRYLYLADKMRELSCLAVSPNKRIIAVADKGDKPMITIYETASLKRKKVLFPPPDSQASEFHNIYFTQDNKFLMVILGEPDWMFVSYMWDKGKVDSSYKAFNPQNPGPVLEIAPSPFDSNSICAVGPGLFRLLQLSENQWKQFGFCKSDMYPLTCACWLTPDRVLAGTEDGRLLYVETGDLKAIYRANDVQTLDFKTIEFPLAAVDEEVLASGSMTDFTHVRIHELVSFSRGLAFAIGMSTVILFEKETNTKYLKRNVFKLEAVPVHDEKSVTESPINSLQTLAISPNLNSLIVTTGRSQLFTVSLWGPDIQERAEILFVPLGERLHQGPITALAMCSWKTIFMTCGDDHTVRVWNYTSDILELSKWFQEDILSAALHPTGLFALVGFTDKLRYMELQIDDIKTMGEFPLRGCKLCSFSKNGHLFAAAENNIIHIHSSITYEVMYHLKGHTAEITGFSWNSKDTKLVSCGLDGAVFEWNTHVGKKMGEFIDKSCPLNSVNVTTDGKTEYVAGSDGCVKEISESQLVRESLILKDGLESVVLSRSDLMLFVSGGNGSVCSVKFPLSHETDFHEFHMHNRPVRAMCLSYDDLLLITCSQDGSICLWKVPATEGKTVKLDKDFQFSTNILIPKDELADKIANIKDLTVKMEELVTEHANKMNHIEDEQANKIKEIHEAYGQAIKDLKDKIKNTGNEHTMEIRTLNNDIIMLKDEHEHNVQALEANFKAKLVVEYDKYAALDERTHQTRQMFTQQLNDLAYSKKKAIEELTSSYEARLREKLLKIEDLHREAATLDRNDEEVNRQIEDDADREIMDMKTLYEGKLKDERETIVKLRAEAGQMRKKYIGSQKEIEYYKQQIAKLHGQHQKVLKQIGSHDRAISDLKREMQERDATIPEKESRIYDLKRKNQELEKYRFVLNYKIKELQNQIRPKEEEITEKKQQLAEMEEELEGLQKINVSLELQTQELKEKLTATNNELDKERNENKKNNATLNRMRLDIHNAYGIINELKKLKSAIKDLYHKYSMDPAYVSTRKVDEDIQDEFMRQREFLEHTIKVLRKQVTLQTLGRTCEGKIMEEHAELIEEINHLRRELKYAQHNIRDMESVLGPGAKTINPKQAQDKLEAAIKTREAIKQEYHDRMEKLEAVNEQLKQDVDSLRAQVKEEQMKQVHEEKPKGKEKKALHHLSY